ncbi:MAG: glycosyltransferase family 2 protein [Desulfobulbaceae bacterium]|nr:glycosyltransferase family 2 protein [Desulfobulbaceae bacterium]
MKQEKLNQQLLDKRNKPFFSIIIPTYNRAKFVIHAIESIMTQSGNNFEVIVIDDGSTDNTAEALIPYRSRIKYFYTSNNGVSSARNFGIKKSTGDWIGFLDSDDEWLPGYLSRQRENIKAHPECCMHMMNSFQVDLSGKQVNTFKANCSPILAKHSVLKPEDPFCFSLENYLCYLQSTVIRKSSLLAAGMFNENLSMIEDLDLVARVALQGSMRLYNAPMAYIFRRKESHVHLSAQMRKNGIRTLDIFGEIYRNLLAIPGLNFKRRKLLRKLYGANRRAVGNLYISKVGSQSKAINHYWCAMQVDGSWRSAMRLFLAILPNNKITKTTFKEWDINP